MPRADGARVPGEEQGQQDDRAKVGDGRSREHELSESSFAQALFHQNRGHQTEGCGRKHDPDKKGRANLPRREPDGPTAIPSTISSTTAGSRSFRINPSASGAANATAATMTTLENEISVMRLLQSRPKSAPPRFGSWVEAGT